MNSAFHRLKNLLDEHQFKLIGIVGPPRTGSTALERALCGSPSVVAHCNEPWSSACLAGGAEGVVQQVARSISSSRSAERRTRGPSFVLVKDISTYLPPGEDAEQWFGLMDSVIVIVRNPVLTTESLLRMILIEMGRHSDSPWSKAQYELLRDLGCSEWRDAVARLTSGERLCELDVFLEKFLPTAYRGMFFLDEEAFSSTQKKLGRDASEFAKYGVFGWYHLRSHLALLRRLRARVTVVDSTVARLMPHKVVQYLCRETGLCFGDSMLDWSASQPAFDINYSVPEGGAPFYDRVLASTRILSPSEVPLPPHRLPSTVVHHLLHPEGAFETYLDAVRFHGAPGESAHFGGSEPTLVWNEILSSGFHGVDPLFSYLIARHALEPGSTVANQAATTLGRHREEYAPYYECIDRCLSSATR
jgi:hypothetical protein